MLMHYLATNVVIETAMQAAATATTTVTIHHPVHHPYPLSPSPPSIKHMKKSALSVSPTSK
jgi:hypothetical protein